MKRGLFCLIALGAIAGCKSAADRSKAPGKEPRAQAGSSTATGYRIDPSEVVAEWNGGKITYGELRAKHDSTFRKIENKYRLDMFQAEQRQLEATVIDSLIEQAASKAGKQPMEYMQAVAGTPQVSDEEIAAFYEKNAKGSGQSLDQLRDRIRGYLQGNLQREAIQKEVERLKAEANVKIALPQPESIAVSLPVDGRPMKGSPNAKVTVVEFSDFECPYCGQAVGSLKELMAAFPNDLKVYFLHFPLSGHPNAMPAAIAAECAHQQGKFWDFHDRLFSKQHELDPALYESAAKDLGLDVTRFKQCSEDPATKAAVMKDFEAGETAGVEGTPAFYVNGVPSAHGVPDADSIRQALAAAK